MEDRTRLAALSANTVIDTSGILAEIGRASCRERV